MKALQIVRNKTLKIMYRTLPETTKQSLQDLWEKKRSKQPESSNARKQCLDLWDLSNIKEIDARCLKDLYRMTLIRSFNDLYKNV